MLQNEEIEQVYHIMSSPWLKKNLDFNCLKCFRMKELGMIITNYNHGWGKVWILILEILTFVRFFLIFLTIPGRVSSHLPNKKILLSFHLAERRTTNPKVVHIPLQVQVFGFSPLWSVWHGQDEHDITSRVSWTLIFKNPMSSLYIFKCWMMNVFAQE